MTTSSDNTTPSVTRPEAKNWDAFTNQVEPSAKVQFGSWVDTQLVALEESQKRFVTRQTIAKSLRR